MGGMDLEILEKLIGKKIEIVNDEHFIKRGKITDVFGSSIAFFTDGKMIFLSFDRIKEIRPIGGGCNDY